MSAKAQTKTGALLVEARTEELPPQLLSGLANQFPDSLLTNLQKAGFADAESLREKDAEGRPKLLATPRRIAALLKNIRRAAPDRALTRRGPQVAAALDKDGKPTKALEGFLRATNSRIGDLRKVTEKDKEYFAADLREEGGTLDGKLAAIVQETLLSLNAPRLMRWGDNDWRFIRPLRGMVMLWETEEIAGEVMGVKAGRTTQGHRFLSDGAVEIESAEEYERVMQEMGRVIVDLNVRRENIVEQMSQELSESECALDDFPQNEKHEFSHNGKIFKHGVILQEITTLCESPSVYRINIPDGLTDGLPPPCLWMCIQEQQKMFQIGKQADLEHRPTQCIVVADNCPQNDESMLRGFESVLTARLRDLRFYYKMDRNLPLDEYREKLKATTYYPTLGSQHDRVERARQIAESIAGRGRMELSPKKKEEVDRAILLCKAALPTLMVGEYPKLEAFMSAEYFCGNEPQDIRMAVRGHEDSCLPGERGVKTCVSIAFHLEKLVGMFGVGEIPTGGKDPHGLRTNAAYLARTLCHLRPNEYSANFSLEDILEDAAKAFGRGFGKVEAAVFEFVVERGKRQFLSELSKMHHFRHLNPEAVNAAFTARPLVCHQAHGKALAIHEFIVSGNRQGIASLVAANKRINNIFRKSSVNIDELPPLNVQMLQPEELDLLDAMRYVEEQEKAHIQAAEKEPIPADAKKHYLKALTVLAEKIAAPVDAFFDKVMVNADDEKIRANRFALLAELRALLNQVADISKLAG